MFFKNYMLLLPLAVYVIASDETPNDIIKLVKLVYYHGPLFDDRQIYDLDDSASILKHPKFIHNRTNCFMPGFNVSQNSHTVQVVANSYLKGNAINLISIDWQVLALNNYLEAQQILIKLGPIVADSLIKLIKAGLNMETFILVGHSLAGEGIGIIARAIQERSNYTMILPRITALDPSNPKMHDPWILEPIQKTDANFVDVIHSDAGGIGQLFSNATAQFWPNGGKAIQPPCRSYGDDRCSHHESWALWAFSVAFENSRALIAYKWNKWNSKDNSNSKPVMMGVNCPTSAEGNYFLAIDTDYGTVPGKGIPV